MTNKLYALDFDGVICDSAVETAITGWKVANTLWTDMPATLPPSLLELFRQVRPVMETGYEATLIIRLLFEGMAPSTLLEHFHQHIEALMIRDELSVDELKQVFGQTRDAWIANDMNDWIAMNPLFEGIANKLNSLDLEHSYIITTKQERFVNHILQANNIDFPRAQIFGLDRNLSKQQILSDLSADKPEAEILFVEDRLPTLINVITDDRLDHVKLYFASWGYNTTEDKNTAKEIKRITALQLAELAQL